MSIYRLLDLGLGFKLDRSSTRLCFDISHSLIALSIPVLIVPAVLQLTTKRGVALSELS